MGRAFYVGCISLIKTVLILVAVARLLQGGSFSIVLGLLLIVYLIGFWIYIIVRAAKGPISREGSPTTSQAHAQDAITDAPSVGSTPAQASRQTHTVMDFKEEDRLDDDDSGWTQGGVTSGRVHLKTGTFSSVPATLEKTETELALITHDVEK